MTDEMNQNAEGGAAVADAEETKAEETIEYSLGTIEDLPGSKKKIQLTAPWSVFEKKTDEIFDELKGTAAIDGFRPGKAPMRLLKARFGKDAKNESLEQILTQCLKQLEPDHKITVYQREDTTMPDAGEKGKDLEFEVTVEVKPTVDPQNYDSFDIEIVEHPVKEEDVEKQIEQIRRSNASFEEKNDDDPIEATDSITITTTVRDPDGEPMDNMSWSERELDEPGRMLPAFIHEQIIGKKAGDSLTVEDKLDSDEDGSKALSWEIKIHSARRLALPDLDDEFAKDLGEFETLEQLRQRIRDDMQAQEDQRQREEIEAKIDDMLIERNPMELPASLIAMQKYEFLQRDMQRMQQMGLPPQMLGGDEYAERLEARAKNYIMAAFIHEAIGDKEGLTASEADVQAELERRAEAAGRKPLAIRAQLEKEGQWDGFQEQLKMKRVADLLVERANVKKVEPKEEVSEETDES